MIKLSDLLNESNVTPYLERPNNNGRTTKNISLVMGRDLGKPRAWYGLQTDSWFRKYFEPGKNYGLMIRKFKVTGAGIPYKVDDGICYPVAFSYLPSEFDDMENDDVSKNYEHERGYLVIGNDIRGKVSESDVEQFVNSNIPKYKA